ncbi:MAG: OadG family protein [Desulfosalsimonas sp.]
MPGFDTKLALTIAAGGLGVVFIILILLAFAIGITRRIAERISGPGESGKKD